MFDRKKYKRFAKIQLQNRWKVPILMTLVTALILSIFAIPEVIGMINNGITDLIIEGDYKNAYLVYSDLQSSPKTMIISIVQSIIAEAFIIAALNVYLKMTRSPDKVSFSGFIEGFNNWGRATLCFLWQTIWIVLWTMIFVIPGIVKAYAYSQMRYLIAEYDNISVTKAMRVSIEITKGHKWELFVMDLSFLGWELLNYLTLGILSLYVTPYKTLAMTNAYHAMLKEAVECGRIRPEDLSE